MKKQKIAIIWIFVAMFVTSILLMFNSNLKPLRRGADKYLGQNSMNLNLSANGYEAEGISTKRIYRNNKIITTGTKNSKGMKALGNVDKIQFFGLPTYEEVDASNKKIQSFGIEKISITDTNDVEKTNTLSLETIYANGDKNIRNNSFTAEYNENKFAHDSFNKTTITSKNVKDYANVSLGLKNSMRAPIESISLKLPASYSKSLATLNNKDAGWNNFTSSIGSIYIQSGETIYRSQSNLDIKKFLDPKTNTINLDKAPIKWSIYSIYGDDKNAFITIPKAPTKLTNFVYTTQAQPEKAYSVPTPLMNYVMKYKEVEKDNIYDAPKWENLIIEPENVQSYNYLDFALVARDSELMKVITQISDSNRPKTKNLDLIDFINTFNKEEFFNNIVHNQRKLSVGFVKKTKDTSAVSFASLGFLKFVSWRDGINLDQINLYIKNNFESGEITPENLKTLNAHHFHTKDLHAFNKINGVQHIFFEFNKSSDYLPLKVFGKVKDATIKTHELKTLDISTFDELQTKQQWAQVFTTGNPTWMNSARKDFVVIVPKFIGQNSSIIKDFKFKEDLSIKNSHNQLLSFVKSVYATVPTIPELKFNKKTKQYDISTIKVDGVVIEANVINGVLRYDFISQNVDSKNIYYANKEMTEFFTTHFKQKEVDDRGLIRVQGIKTEAQKSFNITNINDPIDYAVIPSNEQIKIDGHKYGSVIANGHAVWNYDLTKIKYYTNNKGTIEYFTSINKLIGKVGPEILRTAISTEIKVIKTNTTNQQYRKEWQEWKKHFVNYSVPSPSYDGVEIPYVTVDGKILDGKFFHDGREVWDWKSIESKVDISKIKWVWEEKVGKNKIIPHLFTSYKDDSGKIRGKVNTFYKDIIVLDREAPIKYNPWIKQKGKMTQKQVEAALKQENFIDGKKTEWLVKNGVFMFKEYKTIKYAVEYWDTKDNKYHTVFFTDPRKLNEFVRTTKGRNTTFTIKSVSLKANNEHEVKRFAEDMQIEPSNAYQEIILDDKKYPVRIHGGMMYYDIDKNHPIKYKYKGKYYSSIERLFQLVGSTIDIEQLSMASYDKPELPNAPFIGEKVFEKDLLDNDVLKQNVDLIKKGIVIDGVRHSFNIYDGKVVLFKELENIQYVVRDSKTKEFHYYTNYALIPQKYKEINLANENDSIYSVDMDTSKFYKMTPKDHWNELKSPTNSKDMVIIRKKVDGVITDVNVLAVNYIDPVTKKKTWVWSDYNAVKAIKYFDGERYFTDMETAFKYSKNFNKLTRVNVQATNLNVLKELTIKSKKEQFKILIYPISLIGSIFVILFLIRLTAFINNKRKK
ncbi:hypothetical protein [Mycoplasma todarodis]|uniref:Uncharacterized protein n=1 Tax=Mycoplasma todarodis TaxID=1937191 RepID=A0A4R0XNC9_9MOLU|nr:hypothetical protein [Mycoplasma todarodis]TCG12072.1 hypothetical protein C4B25_00055 [Mycoplasma todarodis]